MMPEKDRQEFKVAFTTEKVATRVIAHQSFQI
jgi:hypothetical protein